MLYDVKAWIRGGTGPGGAHPPYEFKASGVHFVKFVARLLEKCSKSNKKRVYFHPSKIFALDPCLGSITEII